MKEFKNEFSWSVSRDDTFRKCCRMYYFQYYGFWGGWDFAADKRTRTNYILKQLQTRQMWAGSKVHECIKNALSEIKAGIGKIDTEQKIETTLNLMRKEFLNSKNKKYLTDPKSCALFEHEYELEVSDNEWKKNADHVVKCLKLFFNSNVYREIKKLSSKQWLEIEQFSSFFFRDIKIYSVFDFAYRHNDEVIIYDWKTGKEEPDKHKHQLACYGLFAMKKWKLKPEHIKLEEFYLSSGKQNEYNLNKFDLDDIQKYIWISIEEMQNMLDDRKVNVAIENQFSYSENTKICEYCNYQKICPKSLLSGYKSNNINCLEESSS